MFIELKNKNKDLQSSSQLTQFSILQILTNKEKLYNIWSSFMLNTKRAKSDYMYFDIYKVKEKAFWDNIAYEVYGKAEYWWVIAFFNNIQNPFEALHVGQELHILKTVYIPLLLKQLESL